MSISRWSPDWLDLKAYPVPGKASDLDWAWEFIRRNANYQKLYSEYEKILIAEFGEQRVAADRCRWWNASTKEARINIVSTDNKAREYGLRGLVNPCKTADVVTFVTSKDLYHFTRASEEAYHSILDLPPDHTLESTELLTY